MAEQPPQPPPAPVAAAAPPALPLSEDEADDLLYCARMGELAELQETLAAAVARVGGDNNETEATTTLAVLAAARDGSQNTPLHMAAANGHADVVAFLLAAAAAAPRPQAQAFLDAANAFGNTALHWAALNGRLAVVRQLVEGVKTGGGGSNGLRCSVALANDKNYIPLDLASLHGHGAVADYFMAEAEARAAREGPKPTEGEAAEKAEATEEAEEAEEAGLRTATESLALQDGP